MSDPLASILAARGGLTFNQAFAAARGRGDDTFEWMNPQTGKVGRYTTARADDKRMRLPRGMKESDLYRDSRKEQPMRDSEARQRAIEEEYQQNLRNIRSEFETADKRDLQRYTSDMEPYEKQERDFAKHMEDMRRYEAREAIEGPMQEEYEREALANRAEMDRLRALQNQLQQEVYRNEQTSLQREIDENEQKVLQEWAAGKRKEQALERVYPEALAPVGRAAISTGKGLAAILDRLMRNQATQRQPMRYLDRQEPELNFAYGGAVNSMYAPSYAQGGIAGLAAKGRGGDSMLVHMSPDEVQRLQQLAQAQGTTLTINPDTGLPEAFKLRKLLRGLATLAPIAAAFFPPLAAAMPFLTTPLGAGLAGGVAGGLSGDKGFDLKRGLMGGALSYGLSSAAQGLKAAGAPGSEVASIGGAQSFTPAEVAALSPQAQAAISSAPVAAPFSPSDATSFFAAQEAGLSAAPSLVPPSPGSMSQGISNLLSSDAATREAAQKAFSSQFGRGAMAATGIGALGTAALSEQEGAAKAAKEAGRISQAEYEKFMAEIAATRRRNQYIVQQNPFKLRSGGAISRMGKPVTGQPIRFYDGGDGGGGDPSGDDGGGPSAADAAAAAESNAAAADAAIGGTGFGGDYGGMTGSDFGGLAIDGGLAAAAANAAAANAAAEANAAANIGSMGGGDSQIPLSILLDSPLKDFTSRKKTFAEMTPEEQEIERRRYMMLQNPFKLKKGGIAALPPRYINGAGDGMSDSVPATINNTQPARLADGEFVIPADVVSHLGNGSSKAGAKQLYAMMDRVRKARTGTMRQGKSISPAKHMPV